MANECTWKDYKKGNKPTEYKFYLVEVDNTIGGNFRQYIAQFRKDQIGVDTFSSRDVYIPEDLFDKAVTHWLEIPDKHK